MTPMNPVYTRSKLYQAQTTNHTTPEDT